MEQNSILKPNRFIASREIPSVVCNPKVHHRFNTSSPLFQSWFPVPNLRHCRPFNPIALIFI